MALESVPATVFRGGTSKGVYFREEALPPDRADRERLLLSAFGSPDPMQLDGIGGSHSTTSKAMVVAPADDPEVDVAYRFAQVGVEKPVVDWGGNCGNLTFAVGPHAIESGAVSVTPGERADLVLRNVNTGTVVEQTVPVDADARPRYDGDFVVHGVPGTGSRIRSRFLDPGGSVTGSVFPTGNRTDTLDVEGVGSVDVSLVDVSNPCAFVRAHDVGLAGTEVPAVIDGDDRTRDVLERIRSTAAATLGFVDDATTATSTSPGIPKVAVVGERRQYRTVDDSVVEPDEYDLLARIMSMQKAHHAYSVTGAMCTAAAATFPGTIPNEFVPADVGDRIVIGHPKGTMAVGVDADASAGEVAHTTVDRTARKIMAGTLFYRL